MRVYSASIFLITSENLIFKIKNITHKIQDFEEIEQKLFKILKLYNDNNNWIWNELTSMSP